jgi:hypothetical protein
MSNASISAEGTWCMFHDRMISRIAGSSSGRAGLIVKLDIG